MCPRSKIPRTKSFQLSSNSAFDESGHYIRKKDDQAIHDNWLQGVTKNQILRAKAAHQRQEARAQIESAHEERALMNVDSNRLWYQILSYMNPGESVAGVGVSCFGNAYEQINQVSTKIA